ncbi:hypothetical protein D3C86_1562370 [compost metagenome]
MVAAGEDARHLGVCDVDAVDHEVRVGAVRERAHLLVGTHRVERVALDHFDGLGHLLEEIGLALGRHDADDLAFGAREVRGHPRAEHAALARSAQDHDLHAGFDQAGGLRGRAAHVEHRHGELLGQIGRDLGEEALLEEEGAAHDLDLVRVPVDVADRFEEERGGGQRDEGDDAIADRKVRARAAHLGHAADEHAARAGDRVVHLAALGDDLH